MRTGMNTARARARFVSDGLAVLTPPRLLIALYERLVRDLCDASAAIRDGNVVPAHDALVHAQDILDELMLALDADAWDGAAHLTTLYEWTHRQLVVANITKDAELVDACLAVVEPLRAAWAEALVAGPVDGLTEAIP
jgi:flagellar secretion chaperone FliS